MQQEFLPLLPDIWLGLHASQINCTYQWIMVALKGVAFIILLVKWHIHYEPSPLQNVEIEP